MNKLTDKQKIEAVEKYITGKYTCKSLGEEYGIRGDSMRALLLRRNVKLKTRSEACRKYTLDEDFFNNIDTEEKAYFLGLLYADGYNNEKRGEIHLTLQEEDKHILETFRDFIKSTRPLLFIDLSNRGTKTQKNVYRFDISSKKISKRLNELGCMQAKSMILKFPSTDLVPEELLKHFIRGYFDGDGCFVSSLVKNSYKQFSVAFVSTKSFCDDLGLFLLKELNITTFQNKRHKEKIDNNRTLHISGNKQIIKFMDWIYKDAKIYLNRKYQKYVDAITK